MEPSPNILGVYQMSFRQLDNTQYRDAHSTIPLSEASFSV